MSFLDWLAGKNNPKLPKSEYLYGTRHLIVLGIVLVSAVVLSLILRNKSQKTKKIFFKICASIFLFFEIAQRIVNLVFADSYSFSWVMQKLLPLYFCSIAVVCIIIAIFTNFQPLINATAIMGLLVTTAYLLFPATGLNKTYISFDAFYSISSHCFGFVVSVLLITTRYAKFEFKDMWKTFVIFGIIIAYGLITSLVFFPNTDDYVFILKNPLEFESIVPYPIIYILFISAWISLFYVAEFSIGKIKQKQKEKKSIEKKDSPINS